MNFRVNVLLFVKLDSLVQLSAEKEEHCCLSCWTTYDTTMRKQLVWLKNVFSFFQLFFFDKSILLIVLHFDIHFNKRINDKSKVT